MSHFHRHTWTWQLNMQDSLADTGNSKVLYGSPDAQYFDDGRFSNGAQCRESVLQTKLRNSYKVVAQ